MSRYPSFNCDPGLRWKGAWDAGTNYYKGDAVASGSISYICTVAHTNQTPPNASYWDVMVSGGGGDVTGPASVTANAPAIFADVSGDVLAEGTFGTGAGEFAEGDHTHADMVGDSGSGGTAGFAPAPGVGDATKYLKGDGTWASVLTSFDLVDDTTPQLGGDLDANGNNIALDSTNGLVDENGNEQLILTTTASAVNYATLTNAATAGDVAIGVTGTDTDVSLDLTTKGAGVVKVNGTAFGTAAFVDTGTSENNIALLGSGGKFPASMMPDSVVGGMNYQGTWDADTNNPTIPAAAAGNKGYMYKVSVAGATNVDGITDWKVGDWIVSNGTSWDKVDNTESVSSVASKTGAVTLVVADITDAGAAASLDVGTSAGTVAAGDHTHSYLSAVVDDTTPQLGGDLDTNGNNVVIDTTKGLIDENANEQLILTTTASAVNYATLTNAATGNAVALGVTGTDTDVSMNLTTKGAGVVQVNGIALGSLYAAASHNHAASEVTSGTFDAARLPVMVGDSGAGGTQGAVPAPGAGEASYFLRGDGTWVSVAAGGGDIVGPASVTDSTPLLWDGTTGDLVKSGAFGTGAGEFAEGNHTHTYLANVVEDTTPQLGGDLDTNGNNVAIDTTKGLVDENGNEQLILTTTASAVNYATLTNAAAAGDVKIGATGTDTDVSLDLTTKGAGVVKVNGTSLGDAALKDTGTSAGTVAAGDHTHAAYGDVTGPGSVTANNPVIWGDTSGDLLAEGAFGTGAGQFAEGNHTHSSGMGDVVGPASSTAEAVAIFDGTTGKLLKNGVAGASDGDLLTWQSGAWAAVAPQGGGTKRYEIPAPIWRDDSAATGVSGGQYGNVYECRDFDHTDDGAVWFNFNALDVWDTAADILFEIWYTLDGTDNTKVVKLQTDYWVTGDAGGPPDELTPDGTGADDITSSATNTSKLTKLALTNGKIANADLASLDSIIAVKVTRLASDAGDTYSGIFKLVKVIAYQA